MHKSARLMGSVVLCWTPLTSHVIGVPFPMMVGAGHKLSPSGLALLGMACDEER